MMYLLDSDHISMIHRAGEEGKRIEKRMDQIASDQIALCIITYEEQMRGWLAEIARVRSLEQQKPRYVELNRMLELYCSTPLLSFDDKAIFIYQSLWLKRLRVGTMDLKIASIALANEATLLTRNSSDFQKIPDLRIENWSY